MRRRLYNKFEEVKKYIEGYGEQVVRYRMTTYKGIGRPKKSDYVLLKRKDIREYRLWELFANGFK